VNLAEIEENVAKLDLSAGFDFIYDLLLAYDLPKPAQTSSNDKRPTTAKLEPSDTATQFRFVDESRYLPRRACSPVSLLF